MDLSVFDENAPIGLSELENILTSLRPDNDKFSKRWNRLLFRGQADTTWPLETTLERYLRNEMLKDSSECGVRSYYGYLGGDGSSN